MSVIFPQEGVSLMSSQWSPGSLSPEIPQCKRHVHAFEECRQTHCTISFYWGYDLRHCLPKLIQGCASCLRRSERLDPRTVCCHPHLLLLPPRRCWCSHLAKMASHLLLSEQVHGDCKAAIHGDIWSHARNTSSGVEQPGQGACIDGGSQIFDFCSCTSSHRHLSSTLFSQEVLS